MVHKIGIHYCFRYVNIENGEVRQKKKLEHFLFIVSTLRITVSLRVCNCRRKSASVNVTMVTEISTYRPYQEDRLNQYRKWDIFYIDLCQLYLTTCYNILEYKYTLVF